MTYAEECTHHWLLAAPIPEQPVVGGICRKCGIGRDFPMHVPTPVGWNRKFRKRASRKDWGELRVW